ncbi:MAG: Hpt domain-containing protein [Geobacteraceae bacterium]|nr:Hpt domain-containing protein [Geobacteraceae bacterium]
MMNMCRSDILDRGALDNIRSLNSEAEPDVLGKVVAIYLRNSPKLLLRLNEAVSKTDTLAIEQVSHSLKSSSSMLGALELADLLTELEEAGRTLSTADCRELMLAVEAEFARVCNALRVELQYAGNAFD